ncbi:MAG: magnesium/cobalt transporter CorA [Myxococcales bacterium]|nr:magnesium/cobalt transporter CorA [Myxococcales bacterium]
MSKKKTSHTPRRRLRRRRRPPKPVGAPPGTLIASIDAAETSLEVFGIGADEIVHKRGVSLEELQKLRSKWSLIWINVIGLRDVALVERVGNEVGLHKLALEDTLNVGQRPKVELYGDHAQVVLRSYKLDDTLLTEQISVFFGKGYVVTFQEFEGDYFEPIRERLREGRGRVRTGGAAYLAYTLIDTMVDAYFPIFESYGERLHELEERIMDDANPSMLREVRAAKRNLLALRRGLWPLREAFARLERDGQELVDETTRLYLRDTYDHVVQLLDILETYRELAGSLLDIYLTTISNRTAEVSKVLTIIATIFIPLSFIAGLYGMNFDGAKSTLNMPELRWQYGYLYALGLMVCVAGAMMTFFWRKGWIGFGRGGQSAEEPEEAPASAAAAASPPTSGASDGEASS